MKIAYVIEVDPFKNTGIVKKINNQISFWLKSGHQVQAFVLWPNASGNKGIKFLEGQYFSNKLIDLLPSGFLKTYLTKIYCIAGIDDALNNYVPDIVYIRQNIWYPGLPRVLKKYRSILEINSVDYLEMDFYSYLKRKTYMFGKNKIMMAASGLVAISPDIVKHYSHYGLPIAVVSNGIDLSKFKNVPKPLNKNPASLLFVGSKDMQWHGLNKILELAREMPQYTFRIVGYESTDIAGKKPKNMKFYGWMDTKELDKLYTESNIGIGSFGNHFVGKKTDSTLKVLEYLANGLPVILGHKDADFKDTDFVFKITDENNDLIALKSIERFIELNKNRRVTKKEIRKIDSQNKERERLTFFEKIVENQP